jgi:hypothetical protein
VLQDPDVAQLPFDITAWCSPVAEPSLPFVFNRRQQQQEHHQPPVTNALPRPIIGTVVPEPASASASAPAAANILAAPLGLKREATEARGAPWFFTELPAGRFEVAERAGSGAFGLVYKAWDTVEYAFAFASTYILAHLACVIPFLQQQVGRSEAHSTW